MNFWRKNLPILIFLAASLGILWYIGYRQLDPDFGWHLRMGQIIAKIGIPQKDPFSYTMPSYHFVDHEWLTDFLIAKLYPLFGKFGLALVSAIIVLVSLLARVSKLPFRLTAIPLALSIISIINFSGVRPQVLTWLFFAILLLIIETQTAWKRWALFLPLLFLAWANFHGGFAIGLVILFVFIATKTLTKRELERVDILIFFSSVLVTLLNPYGLGLWKEIWNTTSDFSLKFRVDEWLPAFYFLNLTIWTLVSLSISLVIVYRKKFSLFQLLVYFLLLLAGLSSIKYLPFWTIFSLPMTGTTIVWLAEAAKSNRVSARRFNLSYRLTIVVVAAVIILNFICSWNSIGDSSENRFYPAEAANYLRKNIPAGEIFSEYEWGGYLIWELPAKKVFIDGRMPSWRLTNPARGESANAFKDYLAIKNGDLKFKDVSDKYNITTVLWSVPKKGAKDNYPPFINQITALGWREIYKDSVAVIYQKPR